MQKIFFYVFILFCAFNSNAQFQKEGVGVIGFFQTDSVFYSPNAKSDNLRPALNAVEWLPEVQGDFVYGPIVWQCIADSAEWYKSIMHFYIVTEEGAIVGDSTAVGYVRHGKFVEFQKWERYLKGKYIFSVAKGNTFLSAIDQKTVLECDQKNCLRIESVKGDMVKVVTPKESDCAQLKQQCITEAWLRWHDAKGKLLIQLTPQ